MFLLIETDSRTSQTYKQSRPLDYILSILYLALYGGGSTIFLTFGMVVILSVD